MSDEFTLDAKFKASNLIAEHARYEAALTEIADRPFLGPTDAAAMQQIAHEALYEGPDSSAVSREGEGKAAGPAPVSVGGEDQPSAGATTSEKRSA